MTKPQLLTPKTTYTIDYPQAIEFATQQTDIFWTPTEIELEKDLHELRTGLTEAELHGVVTTLKLFMKRRATHSFIFCGTTRISSASL